VIALFHRCQDTRDIPHGRHDTALRGELQKSLRGGTM
jgi:hypothetical protein